jgi:hypothetical protein
MQVVCVGGGSLAPPLAIPGSPASLHAPPRPATPNPNPPKVLSLNGTRILNLRHLAELVASCSEPYLRFDCEYREVIVLQRDAAFKDTAQARAARRRRRGGGRGRAPRACAGLV